MSGDLPTVTVIICAYTAKRWDDMMSAIASAVRQPEATEVIVVIDHDEVLLARTRRAWGGLLVVENRHKQGLSGARNTGLERASGEVVAFLDDDAVAADDWLRRMLPQFALEGVVAVGGRADPVWPAGTAPQRMPAELWWIVGCSYQGLPVERATVRNVIGCSMAIRRDPLREIGGFNLDAGRVGQHPLGAEETEACIKLRAAQNGREVVYEPSSVVRHRVTADRVTWRYIRRRSYFEGISKAALSKTLGSADALSSERSYTSRVLPSAVVREIAHGRLSGAFAILLSLAAAAAGYAYGSVHRHTPGTVIPSAEHEVVR
ncbi:MAG: glycosyltransferase family 2 protein [Glaciihabitans sp.]|nr:glycosyltransferase family 2 protein [Glaciihabitans sp.]